MKRKGSKQKKDDPDKRGPKFLIWLVTTKCNLKCSHCYAAKFADGELSLEEKFSVVRDAVQTGIKEINLTGGEILLHKDGLKLINYIAEQGMDLNVFTNGTTLSEKVVKELAKNEVFVLLSLDGAKKESHEQIRGVGTWELTISGARR